MVGAGSGRDVTAKSPSIGSAVGRLMAVFDDARGVEAGSSALVAPGVPAGGIETFSGPDAAAAFDASGRRHGPLGVVYRIFEFSWADQAPDFAWYEAAVREGRIVMSVRVRGQRHVAHAARIIEEAGGHFINHFGWSEPEAPAGWRGGEPAVPGSLGR